MTNKTIQETIVKPKEFERKPLNFSTCKFYDYYWNDPEQRNYTIDVCNHPKNKGEGDEYRENDVNHDANEYSCHHPNAKMQYRCWGESKKIIKCPMALTETEPEVKCPLFVTEEAHPTKALVTKEELKERFYQPSGLCLACQNCVK